MWSPFVILSTFAVLSNFCHILTPCYLFTFYVIYAPYKCTCCTHHEHNSYSRLIVRSTLCVSTLSQLNKRLWPFWCSGIEAWLVVFHLELSDTLYISAFTSAIVSAYKSCNNGFRLIAYSIDGADALRFEIWVLSFVQMVARVLTKSTLTWTAFTPQAEK